MIIRGHFEAEPGFPRPVKISEAQKDILPRSWLVLVLRLTPPHWYSPPPAPT